MSLQIFSTHINTSNNQPFDSTLCAALTKSVLLHFSSTSSLLLRTPFWTKKIFPISGILLTSILQPTQPARLAVGLSALRFSMIAGTKKYFGMVRKFRTSSVDLSYVRKKKFGLSSPFKLVSIVVS